MKRDSLLGGEQRFHATRFRGTAKPLSQAGKYGGAVTQQPTADPVE